MIKFKELVKEAGGAGDWGTDEARKKLQKDTPGQGITDIGVKNKERKESVELDEATDFRPGDVVYQVGSKLKGTVLHKGNQDKIVVKFGSINKMISASQLRLAEEAELGEEKVIKIVADTNTRKYKEGQVIKTFPETGKGLTQAMVFQKTVKDKYGVHSTMVRESVELDEGTLAAKDSNVIDTILDALRVKLLSDLEKGNVKDAQEIAKLVKMTIEKDYKHKGYSRLKR